jgi:hypothetical protein
MPEGNVFGNETPPEQIDTGGTEDKKGSDPKHGADEAFGTNVVLSEGNSPMELDDRKMEDPKNQYIQYNGVGTVRTMTPDAWRDALKGVEGVEVSDDWYHEWNYLNHKRIPRSLFNEHQLQYLLRIDGRFELVTVDAEATTK